MSSPVPTPYESKLLARLAQLSENGPVPGHRLPNRFDGLALTRERVLRELFIRGKIGVVFGPHWNHRSRRLVPYYYHKGRDGDGRSAVRP